MTIAFTKILILVINAFSADYLAYAAGVIQRVMNDMDEAALNCVTVM